MSINYNFVTIFFVVVSLCNSQKWSFQGVLRVPEAFEAYGEAQGYINGRGFMTGITGGPGPGITDPGIYVHTTSYGLANPGSHVWSQQAKLIPLDSSSKHTFGVTSVYDPYTIMTGAPSYSRGRARNLGAVYVFNGTLRHWSQVQRLVPQDGYLPQQTSRFGEKMSINGNLLLISAAGYDQDNGVAYIYERPAGSVFWTRQAKLQPKDGADYSSTKQSITVGQLFSEHVGLTVSHEIPYAIISSRNDWEKGQHTGSAYIFQGFSGIWSQQQKLLADDILSNEPPRDVDSFNMHLPHRKFAYDVAIDYDVAAVGLERVDRPEYNRDSVYVFNCDKSNNKWSLQQRLFASNVFWKLNREYNDERLTGNIYELPALGVPGQSAGPELIFATNVHMSHNTLIATTKGVNLSASYIFKTSNTLAPLPVPVFDPNFITPQVTVAGAWSMQQRLLSQANGFDMDENTGAITERTKPALANFTNPSLYGGTLLMRGRSEMQIFSQFSPKSCLILYMTDHFGDGWDTAVLTVRAPDTTYDVYAPHCDQPDPFYIRYCPYQPEDEGIYIIKIFAPLSARFYWELSWQVMVENTGIWYKGDFSTKLKFRFDMKSNQFVFVEGLNFVDLNKPCWRCSGIDLLSWQQKQEYMGAAFWPLVATGSPYYISDYEGRSLLVEGHVCDGVETYECYQAFPNGLYLLRLGTGPFGELTKFPRPKARWNGCGSNGTARHQFAFAIHNGECIPMQNYFYKTRCNVPPPFDRTFGGKIGTPPTPLPPGETAAPTQNVFGKPYVQHQMYSFEDPLHFKNGNVEDVFEGVVRDHRSASSSVDSSGEDKVGVDSIGMSELMRRSSMLSEGKDRMESIDEETENVPKEAENSHINTRYESNDESLNNTETPQFLQSDVDRTAHLNSVELEKDDTDTNRTVELDTATSQDGNNAQKKDDNKPRKKKIQWLFDSDHDDNFFP